MKCVALLSGGKDSVMAVHVAREHAWDVPVALCVRPAEDDAWMFHTPGLDVVPAVAECLGLDLVEAPCRTGPEEEVEALQEALVRVRDGHGVDAVLSGALASDYQRTRIDRIGHRVGLKTFAPLWHKEPTAYMQTFAGRGWDVRFSRVAADGLGPTWAGRRLDGGALADLASLPTRPHPAGEGGEFETLVLDAPGYRKRIVVEAAHVEATASRATWVVDSWRIASKGPP